MDVADDNYNMTNKMITYDLTDVDRTIPVSYTHLLGNTHLCTKTRGAIGFIVGMN